MNVTRIAAVLIVMALSVPVRAQTPTQPPTDAPGPSTAPPPITMKTAVQVTATRFGEPVAEVPGAISIVTGDELRARGATDLRMALALLGGVSVAPGGDAGPAAAVPGLLGVREVDDLLVLVDGIPAGGAFIPQIEAITLTNVERIEVLRGAAPVYFGTTAFAGTINVIHYSAGSADRTASVRFGSYRSGAIGGAAVLSSGRVRQSISAEFSQDNLSDERADHGRTQATWRLSAPLGHGRFGADVDVMALRQKPNSPVPIDDTTGEFYAPFPVDYNHNPANAKLDTNRYKAVLEYDVPLSFGRWGNTAAYTQAETDSIRGFLDIEDTPQPWTPTTNADLESFEQALTDLCTTTGDGRVALAREVPLRERAA